jgi:hypothetical protein
VTADLADSLRHTPGNVHFIDEGEERSLADDETFGPEIALAHELSNRWPDREIYLVKYAVGATSLLAWAPNWDSSQAALTRNAQVGPLYDYLLTHVRSDSVPEGAELAAVLWMQGERDARYPEAGEHYGSNLTVLVNRIRSDLRVPSLPFVLGRINPPAERYPALSEVRHAQEIANSTLSNVIMIDIDDLAKRDDEVHYDTEGILELGRRFARAYLAFASADRRAP